MDELFLEKFNKKLDAIAKRAGIHFCPMCASDKYERLYRVCGSDIPWVFVPTDNYKCEECGYEGKIPD